MAYCSTMALAAVVSRLASMNKKPVTVPSLGYASVYNEYSGKTMTSRTFKDAKERTEKARAVSLGEHSFAPIPWDDYRGFPVGVDIKKVVGLNTLPVSHGGSALKTGGQAGAGACDLPLEVFKKAVVGVAETVRRMEGEAE